MIQIGNVFQELRGAASEAEDEAHHALQAFKDLQKAEENLGALSDADAEAMVQALKDLARIYDFAADLNNRLHR